MKKLLLATCLTAIFASGALGQDDWHSGKFWFYTPLDHLLTQGVTFQMDSAWQWEYTDIDAFDGYKVVTLNPDGPLQEQGEWEIAVTAKQAYSIAAFCMHDDSWRFRYKLIGGNDSAGLVLEMSWDSTKWFNLCDSMELSHFFDAATHELDWWNDIYPTPSDSTIITLPDGRKALGPVGDWHEYFFATLPAYTSCFVRVVSAPKYHL